MLLIVIKMDVIWADLKRQGRRASLFSEVSILVGSVFI